MAALKTAVDDSAATEVIFQSIGQCPLTAVVYGTEFLVKCVCKKQGERLRNSQDGIKIMKYIKKKPSKATISIIRLV